MSEYEQIIARAKEQNINLEDKLILIPRDENRFSINGDLRFGRVFEDTAMAVILRDTFTYYNRRICFISKRRKLNSPNMPAYAQLQLVA